MKIIQSSMAEKMYNDVKTLSGFGNRYAGSDAEQKAADFVGTAFKEAGFTIIEEAFPVPAFEEKDSWVEVDGKKFASRAMFYSTSTPDAGLEGVLAYAGIGRPEDYEGIDVNGKIVIIRRDKETEKDQFWPEVCTAAKLGAKAVILINFTSWIFITTLETGLFEAEKRFLPIEPNPIPALIVNNETGACILKMMDAGTKTARIKVDTVIEERQSVNVRAIKKGSAIPDEKILIYGHRDSAGTPGANDNGSGTVIMMEIARILQNFSMKRTVELVSLGAEEQLGAAGSKEYISRHEGELMNIKGAIELDMVAAGSPIWVMQGGNWPDCQIHFHRGICNYVLNTAKLMGYYMEPGFCSLGTPDSGRFSEAGVPTTWIWGPGDIYYHSPEDTADKVDPNKLKVIADIISTAVYNLANADSIDALYEDEGGK